LSKSIYPNKRIRDNDFLYFWFIIPGLVFYILFMLLPLGIIIKESVWQNGITLIFYKQIFENTAFTNILINTLRISLIATVGCFVLSYPFALLLYSYQHRGSKLLYVIFSIPLIVNPLALLYAWLVILQREGVVNYIIIDILRLASTPLQLVYNSFGVIAAMIYLLVPYSIFLTYASLVTIDKNIINSARNLGANWLQLFKKIVLPLSLPGALSGALIVFTLAIGYFITPALLGGLNETMLSMVIQGRMNMPGNWGIASALTMFLLFAISIVFIVLMRIFSRYDLWKNYFLKN
jgi:putative spermidine/putrescine transport system permease protein